MRRLLALGLALLAAPAGAQITTGGCTGPNPSVADETNRALAERHRGLLSRLYSAGGVGVGPAVGAGEVLRSATFEGGYQFDSGDAVAFVTSARTALLRDPVFGTVDVTSGQAVSVGAQYVVGLGRFAPRSAVARRAEFGVGVVAADYGEGGVAAVELSPRVLVPLASFLSAPVGLHVSQPVGGYEGARTYVGLSIGLRTQYVPPSRLVLDCEGFPTGGDDLRRTGFGPR